MKIKSSIIIFVALFNACVPMPEAEPILDNNPTSENTAPEIPEIFVCTAGTSEERSCTTTAGTGKQTRTCSNNQWSSWSSCIVPITPVVFVCTAGTSEERSCTTTAGTGKQTRTCSNNQWSSWSSCIVPNTAPSLSSISNVSLKVGETQNVNVSATDAQGDKITLSFAQSLPSFMFFTDNQNGTGKLEIKPQASSDQGVHNLELFAADDKNAETKKTFSVTVNPASTTTPVPTAAVYFAEDFSNVSINHTVNSDNKLVGWDKLKELVDNVRLNNVITDHRLSYAINYAYQDIVDCNGRKCMYARTIDDDPTKSTVSRTQMSIRFKPTTNLPIYHTSHRMKLGEEIGHFVNWSSRIEWFTIFEIWNQFDSSLGGDSAGSARWGLSIQKDAIGSDGVKKPLYWRFKGEQRQPDEEKYGVLYNKTVPVPLGVWFTLDMYMVRGEGENGRFDVTITIDGQSPVKLFNYVGHTVYPGRPDLPISSWQPFKLYLDDKNLDWMSSQNKKIEAWYNDFKWYVEN
ncbi:MAG: hypothetical protein JNM93_08620 [Bacteriovoracaceae bacterium]|nr:hypothetical protein [Bacteriovoracaceae bacterium]